MADDRTLLHRNTVEQRLIGLGSGGILSTWRVRGMNQVGKGVINGGLHSLLSISGGLLALIIVLADLEEVAVFEEGDFAHRLYAEDASSTLDVGGDTWFAVVEGA